MFLTGDVAERTERASFETQGPPSAAPDCHRGSDERSPSPCPGIQVLAEVYAMFELRPLIRNPEVLVLKLAAGGVLLS